MRSNLENSWFREPGWVGARSRSQDEKHSGAPVLNRVGTGD